MRCNTNNNRATSPIASHLIQHAICCVCVPNPKSVFKERPDIRCVTHNFFCFHIFLLVLNHDDNVRLLAALLLLLLLLLSSWADVLPCRHYHWVDGREILVLFLTTHKNDTNDNYCDSIEPFIESLSVSLSTHPTSHLLCPMVLCPQFLNGPLFLVTLEWEKEFRETVALLFDSSSSCSILTLPLLVERHQPLTSAHFYANYIILEVWWGQNGRSEVAKLFRGGGGGEQEVPLLFHTSFPFLSVVRAQPLHWAN